MLTEDTVKIVEKMNLLITKLRKTQMFADIVDATQFRYACEDPGEDNASKETK